MLGAIEKVHNESYTMDHHRDGEWYLSNHGQEVASLIDRL
ncbi:Unknown protein sequence [Pseudomonas syringae pv. maculicola str. M6]|nr:Unknown protein sequence [Pseudomonas syringae pv. maculicola str. M6]